MCVYCVLFSTKTTLSISYITVQMACDQHSNQRPQSHGSINEPTLNPFYLQVQNCAKIVHAVKSLMQKGVGLRCCQGLWHKMVKALWLVKAVANVRHTVLHTLWPKGSFPFWSWCVQTASLGFPITKRCARQVIQKLS